MARKSTKLDSFQAATLENIRAAGRAGLRWSDVVFEESCHELQAMGLVKYRRTTCGLARLVRVVAV